MNPARYVAISTSSATIRNHHNAAVTAHLYTLLTISIHLFTETSGFIVLLLCMLSMIGATVLRMIDRSPPTRQTEGVDGVDA